MCLFGKPESAAMEAKDEVVHNDNQGTSNVPADDDQVVKESERPGSPPLPPMNML